MNEESRLDGRLPNRMTLADFSRGRRRNETAEQREHRLDRELAAAVYRREQAKAGKGFRFVAPPLRKAA